VHTSSLSKLKFILHKCWVSLFSSKFIDFAITELWTCLCSQSCGITTSWLQLFAQCPRKTYQKLSRSSFANIMSFHARHTFANIGISAHKEFGHYIFWLRVRGTDDKEFSKRMDPFWSTPRWQLAPQGIRCDFWPLPEAATLICQPECKVPCGDTCIYADTFIAFHSWGETFSFRAQGLTK